MPSQIVRGQILINKWIAPHVFVYLSTRRNWHREPFPGWLHSRFMTTSKRVQDRSNNKRVHDLEIATEKCKRTSKVLAVMEILKKEPETIVPVRNLEQHRSRISLSKPHKVSEFLRNRPKLFELYKDHRGVLWCGMTKAATDLLHEQERLLEEYSDKAAEHVTRCLMMSADKRLPLDKIAMLRRDFGLPMDLWKWVHKYPKLFRVVKYGDAAECLELVSWNPAWAITELEKKVIGVTGTGAHEPGLLALPFPMKFPPNYKKLFRHLGEIKHFQTRSYLSPYADCHELTAGSLEFDKRAVAIIHELLSFTIEKRLVTEFLTHFRQEFKMPQKLMRILLKHFGIFYVSERGKSFSVFLTEAYEGQELIEQNPLVLWRQKLLNLVGYRGQNKKIETYSDFTENVDDNNLIEHDTQIQNRSIQFEHDETMCGSEDA